MSSASRTSKQTYPPAVLFAVAAVAAVSLWASAGFYLSTSEFAAANPDRHGIARQQIRFREAAAVLPENTLVGYLSDLSLDEGRGNIAFFGAQYALAPRILVRFPGRYNPDWVVGNFSRPADYQALAAQHRLVVVKDLGKGLIIFRRQGR